MNDHIFFDVFGIGGMPASAHDHFQHHAWRIVRGILLHFPSGEVRHRLVESCRPKAQEVPNLQGSVSAPSSGTSPGCEPLNLAVGRGIIDCDKLGGVKELKLHENQSN